MHAKVPDSIGRIGIFLIKYLQGAVQVEAYFPSDTWYNYQNGSQLAQTGKWITLSAPLDTINVHQRGGSIVPTQRPAVTTTAARQLPFSLQVALDSQGQATGSLYWDDGETLGKHIDLHLYLKKKN